jgi:hypothetical protein
MGFTCSATIDFDAGRIISAFSSMSCQGILDNRPRVGRRPKRADCRAVSFHFRKGVVLMMAAVMIGLMFQFSLVVIGVITLCIRDK